MNKVETQFGEDIYINEYTEYDEEELGVLFSNLRGKLVEAEKSGLTDVYVQFRSTLDPYEDNCAGPVEVQIRGYRERNSLEEAQDKEQKRVQELADKLGVTYYEASVVDRLEKQKKVRL